jgi:sulfur relay (sulfurtransferase) DsrF/TusC family protein
VASPGSPPCFGLELPTQIQPEAVAVLLSRDGVHQVKPGQQVDVLGKRLAEPYFMTLKVAARLRIVAGQLRQIIP